METGVADKSDLYGIETVPGPILAVQTNTSANKASSTVAATFVHVVEIDGVRYESAVVTPTLAALDLRGIWPVAPDDGEQWTADKTNAAKWGVRRSA